MAEKATEQVNRDARKSKWRVYLSDDTKREIRDIHLASEVDVWVASGSYIIILLSAARWWPANRALLPLILLSVCCYSAPCQRSLRVAHCTIYCIPLHIRLSHLHPLGVRELASSIATPDTHCQAFYSCVKLRIYTHTHTFLSHPVSHS